MTRARELNQLLGPKASGQAFDFILDLHNTTANMGTCLIAEGTHNVFAMHLCHYLQVVLWPQVAEWGWGVEENPPLLGAVWFPGIPSLGLAAY